MGRARQRRGLPDVRIDEGAGMLKPLMFGQVPVPNTTAWGAEEEFFLGQCPHAERLAVMQLERQGEGKPIFGKPHMQRQRAAVALELCDLCAKPLKGRTRISLSHAQPVPHGAHGWAILQVEPMLHRPCAQESIFRCPSLKRDIGRGTLRIRQVTRSRCQMAILKPEAVAEFVGQAVIAIGHAKIELLAWKDRDLAWLERGL
jgi:hypothetical protein